MTLMRCRTPSLRPSSSVWLTVSSTCTSPEVTGLCDDYSSLAASYVNVFCPFTCDTCYSSGGDDGGDFECYDDDDAVLEQATRLGYPAIKNCPDVVNAGFCSVSTPSIQKLVDELCPLSCGLCPEPSTTTTMAPLTLAPCTVDAPAFLASP